MRVPQVCTGWGGEGYRRLAAHRAAGLDVPNHILVYPFVRVLNDADVATLRALLRRHVRVVQYAPHATSRRRAQILHPPRRFAVGAVRGDESRDGSDGCRAGPAEGQAADAEAQGPEARCLPDVGLSTRGLHLLADKTRYPQQRPERGRG